MEKAKNVFAFDLFKADALIQKLQVMLVLQVFQGLLRAHKDYHDTKHAMTRLWIHECFRFDTVLFSV